MASTFLAAPFMFVSAKMITVTALSPINYIADLDAFLFDVAIVGVLCTVSKVIPKNGNDPFHCAVLFLKNKDNRIPKRSITT